MGKRAPFNFLQRVELARTYMDDGALLTAANRLEELAADMRRAHWETSPGHVTGSPQDPRSFGAR